MSRELCSPAEHPDTSLRHSPPAVTRPSRSNSISSYHLTSGTMQHIDGRPSTPQQVVPATQLEAEPAANHQYVARVNNPLNVCAQLRRFRYKNELDPDPRMFAEPDKLDGLSSIPLEAAQEWQKATLPRTRTQKMQYKKPFASSAKVPPEPPPGPPATGDSLQSRHSSTGVPPTTLPTSSGAQPATSTCLLGPADPLRSPSASNTKHGVSGITTDTSPISGIRVPADTVRARPQRPLPSRWSWLSIPNGNDIYICSAYPQWEVHSDIHPFSSSFVDIPLRQTAAPLGELPQGYNGVIDPSGMVRYLNDQRRFGDTRSYIEYLATHCTNSDPRTLQPSQVMKGWPDHRELTYLTNRSCAHVSPTWVLRSCQPFSHLERLDLFDSCPPGRLEGPKYQRQEVQRASTILATYCQVR